MVASNRLTTLERVKDWIGVSTSNDDILLNRLIDQQSRFILSYIQRSSLFQNSYTDVYDGKNTKTQMLRNWPVLSVSSVIVGLQTIPALPAPTTGYGCGYVFDPWDGFPPGRPQAVTLRDHTFCQGLSNVSISYVAGFVVQAEPHTVPGAGIYSVAVNEPNGMWAVDQGVSYAGGTSLSPVAYNPSTSLSAGQYMAQSGLYYFSSADAGAAVLISYSYVPADIENACSNMVAERYSYKNRVGTVSKSLGGQETASFSQKDMPDYIRTNLQPYRRVLPI